MILLVADAEVGPDGKRLLSDYETTRVAGADAAADRLASGDVDAVVVDRTSVDDADELVAALRAGERARPDVPLVVLTDRPFEALSLRDSDEVVWYPATGDDVADAVDRALQVGAYRSAVDDLYERCVERATGGATDPLDEPPDLVDARLEADDRLAQLMESPSLLASLLDGDDESEECGEDSVEE